MQPKLIAGVALVNLALIIYTIFIIRFRKKQKMDRANLILFAFGALVNMASTVLMILGSSKGGFSLHSYIGYSGLLSILIALFFSFRKVFAQGFEAEITSPFKRGVSLAYFLWIAAYIAGALVVAMGHGAMG